MDGAAVVAPTIIYDLPNEILDKIFSYLEVLNIGRCMMVIARLIAKQILFTEPK